MAVTLCNQELKVKMKLIKFAGFASRVLPLEADFLEYFHKFEDYEKQTILNKNIQQAKNGSNVDFETNVDKRKYSYIKVWCEQLLQNLDVDYNLERLLNWEKQIMTDSLSIKDDKELLKLFSKQIQII